MKWNILLFESPRGEKPVEEFIKKQQPQAQAKILHKINLLQQYGSRLGIPHSKLLGSGIYELRIRGKEEIRICYCFRKRTIHLLHAFKKQSQKTPRNEFMTALRRFGNIDII
ncbi:addiction module toxin RelE [Candidatus Gottesmanbacteria bacterium CG11_big_fil_rev_8_21_14_0_20_37_11]|uniref:Type II toxin-antitoxin system RelE/ParE family toxin n=3 Tax=Candidatus Gottesmaniibacteriota TaxID=1752720 RepID=A0A2M7RQX9_9BACT|nr:MAG: hypothetical protein AUJ73_00485 [Candidatus Gottesmanbacteria bacterium CG1_02_37_22]PIP32557.1 MAG: addiction module toxin RelE [Candidatus Gottesmanbacteria bacterium CG23_combo_of_CG06-09_8_20_14_all_37_19]PIR08239.1 MAG: addiction module toxin RelE [Candidatus Gottesmanbacteria bacterium CG11_big_fil_rev_8_21_14_0_20_37_11]PIZ02692.1 MAG: type II toxin-antitoxin system RelE/ParE family toxin [Candidatus Gottesmanbacteria bacterium CG_4_10_14_0_8_um_filter_37_24]